MHPLIVLGNHFLGETVRHKLKHLLVGVPRKMVLLKFESIEKHESH